MTTVPAETGAHLYAPFLHRVEKPARYVGGEYNSIIKTDARVRMCLAFPDVYDIGMSHLGTKILYRAVNAEQDLALERCYTPWADMEAELRAHQLPLLSLETARPLSEFDILGFSLQYEMTYTNILTMLDLGGIPFRSEDRPTLAPLVIAGGPCATHPEVLAPFVDAFLVGDAEEMLPMLMRRFTDLKEAGADRTETLIALSQLSGVYVPELYETYIDDINELLVVGAPKHPGVPARVERALLDDINKFPFPTDAPEPVAEAIFDRVSIEIARGCTEGCRFCQAGMIYRPVRERDPDAVLNAMQAALDHGGYDEVSLTSLSTADYSCVSPLIKRAMEKLRPRKASLSVSSLRAYGLDEDLLDEMASVRATGLTFAPEAGTQRMRDVINKNITEEDILTTCTRVFSRGWKRVKLYFMIGLPTETDEDVTGIAELGRMARQVGRRYQRNVDVTVSVSSHIPKPHTPFQWCAMDSLEDIRRKQEILYQRARQDRFKFRKHNMKVSHLEGIVTRGDRRVADLIELAWRRGARFDGWDEHLDWDAWQSALTEWEEAHGLDRQHFLATWRPDGALPWDHIDVGLEDGFLLREYQKALKGRLSPPCGKPAGAQVHHSNLKDAEAEAKRLVCYNCGVACDLSQMVEERKEGLRVLGAFERPAGGEPKVSERDRAHQRFRRGLAPRSFDRGANLAYRIHYTKLGQASLQGHLDVVRMLPRIFRRAGIELVYTEGFHPKPVLSFGPALALGIPSVGELAEVRLMSHQAEDELRERLNEVTSGGLRIVATRQLGSDDRKLSRVLAAQDLLIGAPSEWCAQWEGPGAARGALEARCEALLAESEHVIERIHKGKHKAVDVRKSLGEMVILTRDEWPEVLTISSPFGVRVRLPLNAAFIVARPAELAKVLFGMDVSHANMARLALHARTEDGGCVDPLSLCTGPTEQQAEQQPEQQASPAEAAS